MFTLSSISGCYEPTTGLTYGYDIQFNENKIVSFMKVDKKINFEDIYMVSVTFENYTQLFKFKNKSDRDTFYGTL